MPKIDIAIPCYQYGRFLRQCVASIQSQRIDDVRILIIDNASTDDSAEVARTLALEDRRIEVAIHSKNLGSHASYNEAVDWASSDYFLLLDADDFLVPGSLARAIAVMESHPNVAITYGKIAHLTPRILDGDKSQPEEPTWIISSGQAFIRQACNLSANIDAPTAIRRTSAQKRAGYYRKELPYTDDIELWLRIALQGDVARTNAIQAVRRVHAQQATTFFRDNPVSDLKEHEAAFRSFFAREGQQMNDHATLLQLVLRNFEDHAYWSGLSHVIRGFRREGWDLLHYANKNAPLGIRPPPIRFLSMHQRAAPRALEILAQFSVALRQRPGLHDRS